MSIPCITAHAHPHATNAVVYTALFVFTGIKATGGKDIEDAAKSLDSDGFKQLIHELKSNPEEENYALRLCLSSFIIQTHHDLLEEENGIRCRRQFQGFFNELGNTRQSALGFLQTSSTDDRNFLVALANPR